MNAPRCDLGQLAAALDRLPPSLAGAPEALAHVARLRAELAEATVVEAYGVEASGRYAIVRGDRTLGVVRPYGSVTLHLPTDPPAHGRRLLELDRDGTITVAVRRGPDGDFREAWVRNVDGAFIGVLPGRAAHPLWGASDRLVRVAEHATTTPEALTVSGAVSWDAIASIPPLAEPGRLPPGAGTSVLNLLAGLAADQGAGPLRYRGPYPTEQLFWALTECFRFDPANLDPVAAFTEGGEAALVEGESREAPLDWMPAPCERRFLEHRIAVQLRDGVEKIFWDGRMYYRPAWQGLGRREHRVVRREVGPDGRPTFVAGLQAFGLPLEDHLVLDADGSLVALPAGGPTQAASGADVPIGAPWREALGALLPLEATPLLAPAIDAVWKALDVVWGGVPRDLVEVRGSTLRLSSTLARGYRSGREARSDADRRALAQRFVREVLGLLGPPVRTAAAAWLEGGPAARQEAWLEAAPRVDRRDLAARAAGPLARLLDGLAAGETLPD